MNRYKISQLAEQDLEDIWVYLAQNNQIAADKQVAKILNRLPMLAQFPDIGQMRSGFTLTTQEFSSEALYYILYQA